MDSPSLPKKVGCLWCSPNKASHKKSKENVGFGGRRRTYGHGGFGQREKRKEIDEADVRGERIFS
jgi:hypothetical protein